MQKLETRHIDFEVRAEGDGGRKLIGYAAVFGSLSTDLGGFRERILPGAFAASLSTNDIRALADHDHTRILGRTASGTLKVREDARGLAVEIDLPNTTYARDLAASIERRDIGGMSFGFRVPEGGERFITENGRVVRELSEIDLREVTVTSIPAYDDTELSLRVDPSAIEEARAMTERPRRNAASRKLRGLQASG